MSILRSTPVKSPYALILVASIIITPVATVDYEIRELQREHTPVFLFAGQSNMIGSPYETGCEYTRQSGKGFCGPDYEPQVFDVYDGLITVEEIRGQDLKSLSAIMRQHSSYIKTLKSLEKQVLKVVLPEKSVAETEAASLLRLQQNYPDLFEDLRRPHKGVYCSWAKPAPKGWGTDLVQGERLSPTSGCGDPWGPELTFGHTLSSFDEFGIAKVAKGGTTMRFDWTFADRSDPFSGYCLKALRKRARDCRVTSQLSKRLRRNRM